MKRILVYLFAAAAFIMQANGQVNWTKYIGNPVFPRNPDNRYFDSQIVTNPYVMYDGTTYHMWYSGYDGGNGGAKTGYAYSTDGINWTRHTSPVLAGGASGSWDAVTAFQPCILKDDTTYRMWYCGHDGNLDNRQIGYATGSDSIHWTKYGSNPVLTPGPSGSWDDLFVESPEVLLIDGVYHMWYSGADNKYWQIGHATSPDGINWVKDTLNPVLRVGTPGSWDEQNVIQPSVVFDGTMYHMWYSGGKTPGWDWKTGYAYSMDGRNWIKVSVNNPVMGLGDPGSWDDTFAGVCSVIFDDDKSTYKMWYGGGNGIVIGDIGYATAPEASFDFEKNPFTKYSENPVLKRGADGTWDDVQVGSPTIIYNGSMYHMWYNGNNGSNTNIGYATSTDKKNWDKYPAPVLEHGSTGSWDDLFILHPTVYFDGTTYHMWYTGTNGSVAQIGYATSPDSINWGKYSNNPVLTPGKPGSWDVQNVNSPEVLFIEGTFHMWYGGFDGTQEQIGHATSLNGIDWEKDTLNPVLKVGQTGSWDKANSSQPSVLFDGTYFHMWYGGGSNFGWRIGYAYSEDGRIWHKVDINNPIMGPGLAGDWDSKYVGYQTVCFNSDSTGFDMWYTGSAVNGYIGDIGYAETGSGIVDVENNDFNILPTNYLLYQNYPNPFNPTTKIKYQIPTTGLVSLRVYNLLGEVVANLVNEEKPAGNYEVNFNAANLSSGVYFYRITAGKFVEAKKMILLR